MMFKELDEASKQLSTLAAIVLAAKALVPTLDADRAKQFREGCRRLVCALRETADTIEHAGSEASETRPS